MAGRGGILWVSLLLSFSLSAQHSSSWMYAGVRDMVYSEGLGFGGASWMALGDPLDGAEAKGLHSGFSTLVPYGIGQMASPALGISAGGDAWRFGVAYARSGTRHQHFQRYGLASSLRLGEAVRAGIGLGFLQFRYSESYKPEWILSTQLAFQITLNPELSLHLGLRDPQNVFRPEPHYFVTYPSLSCAMQWKIAESLTSLLEIRRSGKGPLSILGGLELEVNQHTLMYFSFHSHSRRSGLGMKYQLGNIILGCSAAYHPVLGLSPGFEIGFSSSD